MTQFITGSSYGRSQRWLHRIAIVLAVGTVLLIAKGGLVHSAGAGLSVPDWPTTYGENMFTFPVEKWTGGIVYEHGHRLLASGIGMLMIVVAVMVWMIDKRRWLRWLSVAALAAVIVQGLLGGLTVLMRLPTSVSVSHAMLAQSFMIATLLIAAATARGWRNAQDPAPVNVDAGLQKLLLATVLFTFIQILLGAVTRHTYSGMAIIDFPLNNGKVIPDFINFGVAIQFTHRIGAVILSTMIFTQGIRILRSRELRILRTPAMLAMGMVTVQFLLGATVIWTRAAIVPNTLHVMGGALTFATVFITYARSVHFYRFSAPRAKAEHVQFQGMKA
ncbi:MAG: COX15/CtaA family protein [Bacteroidota bacterium]|jgi:cytochrome c oxidase assembly protein subunit 15